MFIFNWIHRKLDISAEFKSFFEKWAKVFLLVVIVAAFMSTGYHHYDEHWQILEFMGLKLGMTSADKLPWEFHNQMRSWAQPLFFFSIIKASFIKNPFIMGLVLRIISGLIAWYSTCLLAICSKYFYKETKHQKWACLAVMFAWFSPYLKVRISSEGLSSSFFAISLSIVIAELYERFEVKQKSNSHKWLFIAGLISGLSFLFRYQMGISIFFMWPWIAFFTKFKLSEHILFAIAVCLGVAAEVPIDYWGYGKLSFAPWNYVYQNIVLDKVSNYSNLPWWYYFKASILKGGLPVSFIFVFSTCLFWIKKPKSILTWVTLPFCLIHMMISGKDLRHLFPVIVLLPLCIPYLIDLASNRKFFSGKVSLNLAKVLISINIILLIQVSLRSANSSIRYYRYIYDNYESQNISKILHKGESPFQIAGLELYFYRPKDIKFTQVNESTNVLKEEIRPFWYMGKRGQEALDALESGCELKFMTYPRWSLKFNFFNWVSRSKVWSLLYCK